MAETTGTPETKPGANWSKVLLIALASLLVIVLVVGVAFAVSGTRRSGTVTGTEVGNCQGGGLCQGSAVGEGGGCENRNGECSANGNCDAECAVNGDCNGDCGQCEAANCSSAKGGCEQGGQCQGRQAPQEQPALQQ